MSLHHVTHAQSEAELQKILDLQQDNLRSHLTAAEIDQEGFVTVIHNLELLREMNSPHPHIISKAGDTVVGFALVMLREYGDKIHVLEPMVTEIDNSSYGGKILRDASYILMGQICIAKDHRKKGLFRKMYTLLESSLKPYFDYIITEIASNNERSLQAHLHTGFHILKRYSTSSTEWILVIKKIA